MKLIKGLFVLLSILIIVKISDPVYESEAFVMYPDRVAQGEFVAEALSRTKISSNYKSPARTQFPSTITFKFAINGEDNEASSGQDHRLTIIPENGKFVSPIITFGAKDPESFVQPDVPKNLPPNTEVTLRLDMRKVLNQMNNKGYYQAWSGEIIRKSEFDGVYIAGGSAPLSWDFSSLTNESAYKLTDEDGDGIYEANIIFNPFDPEKKVVNTWELSNDISGYPTLESSVPMIDALYNMSLDETVMLKEEDGTFRTGKEWAGVWTRDISYSVLLSYAYLDPEISKESLLRKVKNERIIQDTGSGGAWPVSTDRVVWSLAAMELYYVTGDESWLSDSYEIISNSLEDDLANYIFDEELGLFKGESSFLDWREQTYPVWMDNVDISQSLTLGTNAVYYRSLKILAEMASELGKEPEAQHYERLAVRVKEGINRYLWNEEKGYYIQYLYGRHYRTPSPRFEALGNALCIIFDIAEESQKKRIISSAPLIPFGIPTIYPQIPDIPPYHNNGIWPFVQAYWNWSAKEVGNEAAVEKGLASMYRAAALFVTNKENMVAENGDFAETQINSDRQLWSVAGNLAMIYRVFLGMEFTKDGISFSPFIPESFGNEIEVTNFRYRDAIINVIVRGYGDGIESMMVNGREVSVFEIPSELEGNTKILIQLNNQFDSNSDKQKVQNKFSPTSPTVQLQGSKLVWDEVPSSNRYAVYRNGEKLISTTETSMSLNGKSPGFYQVLSVSDNDSESFLSEPVQYYSNKSQEVIEIENSNVNTVSEMISGYSGTGAVEVSTNKNKTLEIPVDIDYSGEYLLSVRYSNGTGPWNTDNNCAIRTIKINGSDSGTLVLPQRGTDEWSNWGNSNYINVHLKSGKNSIEIVYLPRNENMDGEINRAILDRVELIRIQ